MIQLLQTLNGRLTEIREVENGCWINIVDPDDKDTAWLEEHCPPVVEYLTDSLDLDELSRVEKESDYLLVVLRIPHFRGMEYDIPFITLPLLIMQTDSMTITLCKEENAIVQEFVRERVRGLQPTKRTPFFSKFSTKQPPNSLFTFEILTKSLRNWKMSWKIPSKTKKSSGYFNTKRP
jgi:magnesium transporter